MPRRQHTNQVVKNLEDESSTTKSRSVATLREICFQIFAPKLLLLRTTCSMLKLKVKLTKIDAEVCVTSKVMRMLEILALSMCRIFIVHLHNYFNLR